MSAGTLSPNGRVRRSLATEIDRLNQILDGLADGLNDAVASAVQNAVAVAVQQAIQGALTEVLTSPAVIEQLREKILPPTAEETPAPSKDERPSRGNRVLGWIGGQLKAVAAGCAASARAIGRAGMALLHQARKVVTLGRQGIVRGLELASVFGLLAFRLAQRYQLPLLTAAVAGTAVGLVAFGAGRLLATLVCGLGGLLAPVSARAGRWLRCLQGQETWQESPEMTALAG